MKSISIKYQLALAMLLTSFLFFLFIVMSSNLLKQANNVRKTGNEIETLREDLSRLILLDNDFLLYNVREESFYTPQANNYLEKRKGIIKKLDSASLSLTSARITRKFGIGKEFKSMDSLLNSYDYIFKRLVDTYRVRGFKDYGLEGQMREAAHNLEEILSASDKIDLLQLRRNEKDYMLRRDVVYIENFIRIHNRIKEKSANHPQAEKINVLLNKYYTFFMRLVEADELIGYTNELGLRRQLRNVNELLNAKANDIIETTSLKADQGVDDLKRIWVYSSILSLVVSLILAYILAKIISKPLQHFIGQIQGLKLSGTGTIASTESIQVSTLISEVKELEMAFNELIGRLNAQIEEIEESKDQLKNQNEELQTINQKLKSSELALSETNKVKDKFFSIIAHDLRGPIGNLSSFLHMLLKYSESFTKEEIKKFATDMLLSVENVSTLLGNLLEWSRSQMKAVEPAPKLFNPSEIIYRNIELLKNRAALKKIEIKESLDQMPEVFADENMFDVIFRNLLSNAIKFSFEDTLIHISSGLKGKEAFFEIQDKGIGISPSEIDLLFRPTTHFSKVGTMEEKGTGLGLLLCKEFLDKLNGRIEVASNPGKGSIFRYYLPTENPQIRSSTIS